MDTIFESVLSDDREVERLLKMSPDLARLQMTEDYLVETIPHWLYVGDTPLHLAAAALKLNAARLLLGAGADINAANRRGAAPLHYVCDPRPSTGGIWAPQTQTELIKLFLEHGAKLQLVDRGGASALHRAVRARSSEAVRELLRAGARVDARLKKNGSTPLHLAVQSTGAGGTAGAITEQLEIIGLLREYGADCAAKDKNGRTAVDWAKNRSILAALTTR